MELAKIVTLIIGIIVLITVAYAFAGVFAPKIAKISPAANETLQQFIRERTTGTETEPPQGVKDSYSQLQTAFQTAIKSSSSDCFVAYDIKPFRSDFGGFTIQMSNKASEASFFYQISQPAPSQYVQVIDGAKVDCVMRGDDFYHNYIGSSYKYIVTRDITDSSIKGSADGTVELVSSSNFKLSEGTNENDPFTIDGKMLIYKPKDGKRLCFVTRTGIEKGFIEDCVRLNIGIFGIDVRDICKEKIDNIKKC